MVLKAPGAFESIINTALDAFGLMSSDSSIAGTSLEIRQLEGASKQTILLRDRAMPYQEPTWGARLRTKKTTYPGNPIATQQVIVPDDENTTFEGMWKERFLKGSIVVDGNPDTITSVDEATALFHNLIRAGKLVRVQWLSEVRVGLIVGWDVTPLRATDTKWKIEFEWQSRDDSLAGKRGAAFETPSPDDLLNLLNTIDDIMTLGPDMITAFNTVLVQAIRDISDTLARVVDLLRVVESVVSLPGQIVGALKSAVDTLVRQCQELTRRISDRWTEPGAFGRGASFALATSTQSATVTKSRSSAVTAQAQYAGWTRSLALSLGALAFAAQRAYDGAAQRIQPAGLRTITVAEGESLYSLAEKLYGSADFANFLAVSNGLTSARVPPGFVLRAPPRPFGALGNVEMSGGKQSGAAGSFV